MDERALRTWRVARQSGMIKSAPLNVYWSLLDWDWQTRVERHRQALAVGLDEAGACSAESGPIVVYIQNLAGRRANAET